MRHETVCGENVRRLRPRLVKPEPRRPAPLAPCQHERVGLVDERDVTIPAGEKPTDEVVHSELGLQLGELLLDGPAVVREAHDGAERRSRWQPHEEVLRVVAAQPALTQQPHLGREAPPAAVGGRDAASPAPCPPKPVGRHRANLPNGPRGWDAPRPTVSRQPIIPTGATRTGSTRRVWARPRQVLAPPAGVCRQPIVPTRKQRLFRTAPNLEGHVTTDLAMIPVDARRQDRMVGINSRCTLRMSQARSPGMPDIVPRRPLHAAPERLPDVDVRDFGVYNGVAGAGR